MHFVKEAEYLSGYKLKITFSDGIVKIADLEKHLDGEIFIPLKNPEYFKTVRVDPEIDTIVWENGADLSPDFLYNIGVSETETAINK